MAENGAAANANVQPQLNVLAQYVKDLSFENPNAPASLNPQQGGPGVNIQVNIAVREIAPNDYEASLKLEGSGEQNGSVMFKFDVDYAGVFRLTNVAENDVHPILHIECPRLLFPFARQIVADAMRNGGFPPLLIDPIDFVSLYQQRMAAEGQGAPAAQA